MLTAPRLGVSDSSNMDELNGDGVCARVRLCACVRVCAHARVRVRVPFYRSLGDIESWDRRPDSLG